MSFRSALFAASAIIAATNAHITISNPVPYSADQVKIDKGAITAEQYPCKAQYGFTVTTMNSMKVGETQKLEFDGSAVHGGGSCQLSYTTDTEPTKDSVFKVIKSIEGGCPGIDGAKSFEFELPDSIPNGKGTFSWSWFAKMSGAPEMYMNCAPIDVSGGASDASGLDALPNMQIANIGSTTCKSPLNKAFKFPNPGSVLENGGDEDLQDGTGECGTSSGPSPAPETPEANDPVAPETPSTPEMPAASAPAVPEASAPAMNMPAASPSASAPAMDHSMPAASATPSASAPAVSPPAASTMTTIPVPAASAPAMAPPSAPSTGSPSTGGSSCSEDGAIVCNGAEQFGICNGGTIVWQAVAPGTACTSGTIQKRYNGRFARRN